MRHVWRLLSVAVLLSFCVSVMGQVTIWREIYTVKKKDTLYGLAKAYGISIPELMDANPVMKQVGYELKKGDTIFIPFSKQAQEPVAEKPAAVPVSPADKDVRERAIRVGVMLPLHNIDGDGRRMIEYYRGLLMACDSLRREGISTDIHAWNVPIDADIRNTLLAKGAKDCDVIFGPLYTRQVKLLGDFCEQYGIKMVIPFSISGDNAATYNQAFQVYQSGEKLNEKAINAWLDRFGDYHAVFIDCNDTTSKKGIFTFNLRKRLEERGQTYNITNLKSSEESFAKAFSRTQPNVVVLNTGRSPELNVAFAKLNTLTNTVPNLVISMYGYTEWLMYTKVYLQLFHKYDTYIPSTFYYNPLSAKTQKLEQSYRRWFRTDMQNATPRFAITGYDQAQFFLRGLHRYGKSFTGTATENHYQHIQTPLKFRQVGGKGMQNEEFMLVHYTTDHHITNINY